MSEQPKPTLEFLVREVMQWHADKESVDYNGCDHDPCHWCANAMELLKPITPTQPPREEEA